MISRKFFLFVFMNITVLSFADTQFVTGWESDISFIKTDINNPFVPKDILLHKHTLFLGVNGSYISGFNQFTFSLLPGVYFSDTNSSISSGNLKTSFLFYEAYFRVDGLSTTFTIGKQQLGWGVGSIRQYSFLESVSFQDEKNRFYNAEILYRKDAVLLSLGVATDTKSIDMLEAPKWYTPWIYVQYDQPQYTILSSLIMNYQDDLYDVKGALEFKYFLPKNFTIYSTLAYYFLNGNKIGNYQDLRFLAGLNYQYFYNNDIILGPALEYAWEHDDHILSLGTVLILYQIDWLLFFNYSYNEKGQHIPSFFTRIQWNVHEVFKIMFQYAVVKSPQSLEHIIGLNIDLKYN